MPDSSHLLCKSAPARQHPSQNYTASTNALPLYIPVASTLSYSRAHAQPPTPPGFFFPKPHLAHHELIPRQATQDNKPRLNHIRCYCPFGPPLTLILITPTIPNGICNPTRTEGHAHARAHNRIYPTNTDQLANIHHKKPPFFFTNQAFPYSNT